MQYLKAVTLLFFTLIIVFLCGEVFIRCYYPSGDGVFFKCDNDIGWRFKPHKGGVIAYPNDHVKHYLQTNSDGFRDKDFPRDKQNPRICVFGDSFVSNIAVKDKYVFTHVLEKNIKNVDVLNFGVNGYGQVQEYMLIKEVINNYQPDLIVLLIYLQNDFFDNMGYRWISGLKSPSAKFDQNKKELILLPSPPCPQTSDKPASVMIKNSYLIRFVKRRLNILATKMQPFLGKVTQHQTQADTSGIAGSLSRPPEFVICEKRATPSVDKMFAIMEVMVLKINQLCQSNNIPVIFVLAPSSIQADNTMWESALKTFNKNPNDYERNLPNKRLSDFAQKNNLLFLDLLPRLESETLNGKVLYYKHEKHWNIFGNELVADEIKKYIYNNKKIISSLYSNLKDSKN